MAGRGQAAGMRDGYLRGGLAPQATQRQMDVLAAYVAAGGSVQDAAKLVGIRPSTVKRHLADLRSRSGLTTEQLIYAGRAAGSSRRERLTVAVIPMEVVDQRRHPLSPRTSRITASTDYYGRVRAGRTSRDGTSTLSERPNPALRTRV